VKQFIADQLFLFKILHLLNLLLISILKLQEL